MFKDEQCTGGLRESDSKNSLVDLAWLVDRLLDLVADNLTDAGKFRNVPFHSRLEQSRREIASRNGNLIGRPAAEEILDLCSVQFKQIHANRLKRDEYFENIISFLDELPARLECDSKAFHNCLINATDRIHRFSKSEDICDLHSNLEREMTELNGAIHENREREEARNRKLSERIPILRQNLDATRAEASLDALTRIANRRSFDNTLQRWIECHKKSEETFTLGLFDLDDFRQINNGFGHQIGNQILAHAALELGRNIRSKDFLARCGGDKFAVLTSGMDLSVAEKRFSQMLRILEAARLRCRKTDQMEYLSLSFTASCGVAEYALQESARELLSRVHDALYEAKRLGKNRIVANLYL